MERKRFTALLLAALTLFVLLSIATRSTAQEAPVGQSPGRKASRASAQKPAKFRVPDNPSPHPAPEQPIPYSHKQHLAFGLKCQEGPTNPEPGMLMTFPDTARRSA